MLRTTATSTMTRPAHRPGALRAHGFAWRAALACLVALGLWLVAWRPVVAIADEQDAVVRVGYYENEVFQEGADPDAVKTGYAYEYYRKLSEYTGWTYEYVYGDFGELYQMLLDGKIDLLAGLAWKEERADLIGYPNEAMGHEAYNLVCHDTDEGVEPDAASLSGQRIGVLDSAMVDVLNGFLTKNAIDAEVKVYSDGEELYADFDAHEVDLMVAEGDGAYGRSHALVICTLGSSDYFLCVSKPRPDLLNELNTAQAELAVDEPNYLHSLQVKYYPVSMASRAFSESETHWLNTHDHITVGYLNNYMPYSDTDANGSAKGIVSDLVPKMFADLSNRGIAFSYRGYKGYDEMVADLTSGKIDLAFPVGGGLYYAEESGINQSNPVISTVTGLVFKGEFHDDTTSRFAVNEHNLMQYYFVRTYYPDSEINLYPSIEACLEAVIDGDATCTTLNGMRANVVLKNRKFKSLSMMQLGVSDDRCFGVAAGNEGLLKLVNRGTNVVGGDYVLSLAYRYADELYSYSVSDFFFDHIAAFVVAIIAVAAMVITLLLHNIRSAKAQVRVKEAAKNALEAKNRELEASRSALAETDEIVAAAGFGMWHIILEDGKPPRMRGNAKVRELLGVTGKELGEEETYQAWHTAILEDDLPLVDRAIAQMLAGQHGEATYRWEHSEHGQTYVRFGGTVSESEPDHSLLRGYLSDVTDIVREDLEQTEALSQALAAAERANQAKTVFLNNMSHDIRTPMNAIVGFAALATAHAEEPERVRDYLAKLSVSSQHLLSLINDVLDMSRIESGKMTIEEVEVNVPDLIRDLETIVHANATEKNLDLAVDARGVTSERVVTDKLRLDQVLLNILSNAIKFTPAGGRIRLTANELASSEEGMTVLEFRVKDNGIGMSEEFQRHIFDAFTREKTSTVSGIQGTGLGMAITKNIVDMLGGTISVASKEGEGTEFVVHIPCRVCEGASSNAGDIGQGGLPSGDAGASAHKDVDLADLTGKHALLVEDIEMNQIIAVTILRESGIEVDVASDGVEAVEIVSQAPAGTYDIILMDIQMPLMDGYEAARRIRALDDPEKSGIPIVAVTANAFEEDRQLALEAGMNGHVAKPYDIAQILQVLGELLS